MSKEELEDINVMTQRDMIKLTYIKVQEINKTLVVSEKRVRKLEDSNTQLRGIGVGLGLIVTLLSTAALIIALFEKI